MHLPGIAQILTQSLVKSYMVPYNKQIKVHTLVFLTSGPIVLLLYLLLMGAWGISNLGLFKIKLP